MVSYLETVIQTSMWRPGLDLVSALARSLLLGGHRDGTLAPSEVAGLMGSILRSRTMARRMIRIRVTSRLTITFQDEGVSHRHTPRGFSYFAVGGETRPVAAFFFLHFSSSAAPL